MEIEKIKEVEELILNKVMELQSMKDTQLEIYNAIVPPFPRKLNWYSILEYVNYEKEKREYETAVEKKSYGSNELKKEIHLKEKEIISLLPAACTWFKISNLYIGYQTNDWPGSIPELKIVFDNPDGINLPSIKFRKIN